MNGFAGEFERLMASDGRRRPSSPNEITDAWEAFVAECEDGYRWSIYEYRNELAVRDAIESALCAPALERYPELGVFRARVTEIDARFTALLVEGPEVAGSDSRWWNRYLPRKGGHEFVDDAKRLFGLDLTVV